MQKLSLDNLRAAIPLWQDECERLDRIAYAAKTNEDVYYWQARSAVNDDRLRRAFLADTSDRNHWDQVKCCGVKWLLEMAENATVEEAAP